MSSPTRCVLIACGSYNPVTNMHLRMFELARDSMNRTDRFKVISGVISPVGDQYEKKDLVPAKHRCNMLRESLKTSDWIRMDTWECEQPSWTRTAKVLRHHQAILDGTVTNEMDTWECERPSRTRTAKVLKHHQAILDGTDTNKINNPAPSKRRRRDKRDFINEDDDNANYNIRNNTDNTVNLRLLCGADLLESFGTPGLWSDEDIEYIVGKHGLVCITREGSDPRKFIYESDVLTKYEDNIHIITEWIHNDISSTKIRRSLRRGDSVKYLVQDCVIDYINKHGLYGTTVDNKRLNGIIKTPTNEKDVDETKTNVKDEVEDELDGIIYHPQRPPPVQTRHSHIVEEEERPRSPKRVHPNSWIGPPSPKSPRHIFCMKPDIGGLVRRVRNVRIVAIAPETCV